MNKKKGFLGNIIALLLANLGGQTIALMSIPIITRIYSPENYGQLATVWSVVAMFGVISCLKYEETIIIEQDEVQAQMMATNCIFISVMLAIFICLLVSLFELYIDDSYFKIDYAPFVISIGVLCFGLYKAYNCLVIKAKQFKILGFTLLVGSAVSALWKISAGYLLLANVESLLLGNILGLFIPFLLLAFIFRKKYTLNIFFTNFKKRLCVLKSYSDFPTTQAPNAIINAAQQQAPVIILSSYYDSSLIGVYGLAIAVLIKPVNALTNAVSKVYLQKISAQVDDGSYYDELIIILRNLAILALIPSALLVWYGTDIFAVILGNEWRRSGYVATLLIPWFYMVIINAPITQILLVRRELRYIFFYNLSYLVVRVIGIFLSIAYFDDFYMAILVFSVTGFIYNIFYIYKGVLVSKYV